MEEIKFQSAKGSNAQAVFEYTASALQFSSEKKIGIIGEGKIGKKIKDTLSTYVGHIKIHTAIDILTNTLQKSLPHYISENLNYELDLFTAFTEVLFEQSSSLPLQKLIFNSLSQTTKKLHPNVDQNLGDLLEKLGFQRHCDEILYNGQTGQQLKVNVFLL